jgi:hypothetical protein
MTGTMKTAASGLRCHIGLVRIDISEGHVAVIFRVERIHK